MNHPHTTDNGNIDEPSDYTPDELSAEDVASGRGRGRGRGAGRGPWDGAGGPGHGRGEGRRGHGMGRGEGRRGGGRGPGTHDILEEPPTDGGPERRRRGPGHGRGFGPQGPRRAGRGDVRLAILSLLSDAPSNGYGLITAIADRTGDAWRPSSGSVYPTLQQLVDEDLIASRGEGRGIAYELTDTGRTYVEDNDEAITQAWAATAGRNESEVSFHESVTKLKGVIHQFRLAATDAQRAEATERLDETRRALYLILAD